MNKATIAVDEEGWLAAAGLNSPADLLPDADPRQLGGRWETLVKPGLGGRERWRWQPAGTDTTLYVKRYVRTPWREQLDRIRRQAPRHSRAWWEYHQSRELSRRYIPVVRAVAVAEEMHSFFEKHSVVLFEQVAGDALDRVWPKLERAGARLTRTPARQALVRALARFVSAFHQTGVCHRDLYLCHVFADLDPDAHRPPHFTLIDLARTHRPRWRRTRWIIKDLSQLDCSARQIGVSRTDRFRFLITYLGLEPRAPRVRYYARRVTRKSTRILRRITHKSGQA